MQISVVVPCLNEKATIENLLEALVQQSRPLHEFEVIIADGFSTDGTRDSIRAFAANHPDFHLEIVDNPDRTIPAGLNRGILASSGEVVIRLDAHSVPAPDYIEHCLETLSATGAANVGGVWEIKPPYNSWIARGIAVGGSHVLGAGDARYRRGGEAGEVETVPFGAFPRRWLDQVGLFDEQLLTNEDYELNMRLKAAGGLVWFDPEIRSIYFTRATLPALARQYWRYGFWKARMLNKKLSSIRWRQALPVLLVGSVFALVAIGLVWKPAWLILGGILGSYLLVTLISGIAAAVRKGDFGLMLSLPLALWTMHFSWGAGFLRSTSEHFVRKGVGSEKT